MSSRGRIAWLTLLSLGYVLVFYHRLLLDTLVPIDGDMMRLVFPTWAIGHRLFARAMLPLWDGYRNMGCPFLAHPPNQALYPLRRLLIADHFLDFMRMYLVAHAIVAAVPSYLLARRWGGSAHAGLLAALGVAFNGLVVARMTTTIDFASYAWAPLALYALECGQPVGLALALALQWLAGFPPFSLLTGLLLALFAATSEDARGAFRCLVVGAVLAAGLAAVQALPFLGLMHLNARPVILPAGMAEQFGLHPLELIRPLLIPSVILNRLPAVSGSDPAVVGYYLGPLIVGLAVFGAVRGNRRDRRLALAAAAFFILTLGSRLIFYGSIPGIRVFRFPGQWLFPAVLLTALGAARALDRLNRPWIKAAVVAAVAADLLIYAWPARVVWAEASVLETTPRQISMLGAEVPAGRIFFEPALIDLSSSWRLASMADWENLIKIGLPSIPAGYGAREVASRQQLALRSHVDFVEKLAAAPASDPRFDEADVSFVVRLSTPAANVPSPANFQIIRRIGAKGHVFLAWSEGKIGQVGEAGDSLGVEVSGPARLVLSEAFDPGWRALVDGQRRRVEIFDGDFPSIEVPAGPHLIRFVYRPLSFVVGAVISTLTAAFCVALAVRRRYS